MDRTVGHPEEVPEEAGGRQVRRSEGGAVFGKGKVGGKVEHVRLASTREGVEIRRESTGGREEGHDGKLLLKDRLCDNP